jgi:hypothetical protein
MLAEKTGLDGLLALALALCAVAAASQIFAWFGVMLV